MTLGYLHGQNSARSRKGKINNVDKFGLTIFLLAAQYGNYAVKRKLD